MIKSFIYCCRVSTTNKGVEKKVFNTTQAVSNFVRRSNMLIIRKDGLKGHLTLAYRLFFVKEDIVLLRATPFTMFLMFPALLYLRITKKKIIIDVPTPFVNGVEEIRGLKIKGIYKRMIIVTMYLTLPLSLFPAHRILHYSRDSKWFLRGLKNKIIEVGNGINVKKILFRENKPTVNNKEIHITGVATLAFWHGYDRFLYSLEKYNKNNHKYRIIFHIVGDGEEKIKLKKITKELSLEDNVIFHGFQDNDGLNTIFKSTHIGLCSLSLYKINLSYASTLKAREYAARGIPFVLGCEDFDFHTNLDFVYQCANDNSMIDISKIVSWYLGLDNKYHDFTFIREFALQHVDFNVKVESEILSV